jgi:hypothetical protein
MDELGSLLRTLKTNDKITQNALFMVVESARYREAEVGRHILNHYKDTLNKEPLLDFLSVLCSKDVGYLSYFKMHRAELGLGSHKLFGLLGEGPGRRSRIDAKENGAKKFKNEAKEEEGMEGTKEKEGSLEPVPAPKEYKSEVYEQALKRNHSVGEEEQHTGLDNKYLRRAVSPSILYPPNQCKLCGLRYEIDEEGDKAMGLHIDEHRRRSRALDEKGCISREFFSTLEAWTKNIEKIKLMLKVDKKEKIVHSGGSSLCEICKSKIEVAWDDEEDSWVLRDAVALEKGGIMKYCHRECVT